MATVSWPAVLAAVVCLTIVIALLPGRLHVAPLIESDYAYTFIAVDRAMQGHGFTAPPPVAPFVPYEWHGDWEFLTHWPEGYPAILFALRLATGWTTIDAARWLGVVATAAAFVGWFTWIRTNLPRGVAAFLLACVGAVSSVSVGTLVNPSTDLLVTAALPYLLLSVRRFESRSKSLGNNQVENCGPDEGPLPYGRGSEIHVPACKSNDATVRPNIHFAILAIGLYAGTLFWIRYASIFVPVGLTIYLLTRKCEKLRRRLKGFLTFSVGAAIPIVGLLALNSSKTHSSSIQGQLNLGSRVNLAFSWDLVSKAWGEFTNLGFYDSHAWTRYCFAIWPVALVVVVALIPAARSRAKKFLSQSGMRLSLTMVAMLLGMLIVATGCFGEKFHYIGLDRYYVPIRPLYFLLFVGPVLYIPRRIVRAAAALVFLVAMNWTLRQEWSRDYAKARSADRIATLYGEWGRCFEHVAHELYASLTKFQSPGIFLVSNFPDYITLETGIPCSPIPRDQTQLNEWLTRAQQIRGVTDIKPVFVLDPSARWRSHWIPTTESIVAEFKLHPTLIAPTDQQSDSLKSEIYTFAVQ
ncbi:MAG: hypothetical protein HY287_11655 [Planctomycetes bacterium]|nr:hypothetical protein [Planctomycetota bacterium]